MKQAILHEKRLFLCISTQKCEVIMYKNYVFWFRLYKPVSDWLEMLPLDSTGVNM